MRVRMIVPALLTAVMLSGPVLARNASDHHHETSMFSTGAIRPAEKTGTITSAEKCIGLEQQFDEAMKTHGKAAEASELRAEGGELCANGNHGESVMKLKQALRALDVRPKA